jgi:hypothetical protein
MSNTKKTAPKLDKAHAEAIAALDTTAAKIRYLLANKFSRGDVSRILDIRYQWVRNVELQPLKNS